MPELPEVETVKNGLVPHLEGKFIRSVDVYQPKLRYQIPDDFQKTLEGSEIKSISRRAKFLIFNFLNRGILIHLGMSGSMRLVNPLEKRQKHDHVVFNFLDQKLVYHDPRRFGAMDIWRGNPEDHQWLNKLGPEPLGNAFNGAYLHEALKARKLSIKQALLNQNFISGIGNIYASEALWRSKISPERIASSLNLTDCEDLVAAIKKVLQDAIASGGSTLRDHRNIGGELGYFQHKFDVYDREGEKCQRPECDGKVLRLVQAQRSSFYCATCQS